VYLKRIEVEGYRASANAPIVCELGGRFSLILGANGSGKTTINEAIALAHPQRFPRLAPIDATALGGAPRAVRVEYEFEAEASQEGALGQFRKRQGLGAPKWGRPLERSLGQVRAGRPLEPSSEFESIRLVHLPRCGTRSMTYQNKTHVFSLNSSALTSGRILRRVGFDLQARRQRGCSTPSPAMLWLQMSRIASRRISGSLAAAFRNTMNLSVLRRTMTVIWPECSRCLWHC